MLTTRGLGSVLGDLAAMGFDARWGVLGAADVGAKHQRDRIWIVAYTSSFGSKTGFAGSQGWQEGNSNLFINSSVDLADPENKGNVWWDWELGFTQEEHHNRRGSTDGSREWWSVEPNVGRVAHGLAARVDRLKAIGNGQVPLCAATAWRILSE
jgi:DNA (cytosine-5)-methyltransferase 1